MKTPTIRVVNKYTHQPSADAIDFSIMRPSILGNPYTRHASRQTLARHLVPTAELAVEAFNRYATEAMLDSSSDFFREIHRVARFAKDHNINLVCCCVPRPCHGNVLKRIIQEINEF